MCERCRREIIKENAAPKNEEIASTMLLSMSRVYNVVSSFSELKQLINFEFESYQKYFATLTRDFFHKFENILMGK